MAILRHQTRKLQSHLGKNLSSKLNVETNIRILDVTKREENEQSMIFSVDYEYSAKYNGDEASILVEGELTYLCDPEEGSKLLTLWAQKKALPEKSMLECANFALVKGQMLAIVQANELGIESPVRLPHFKVKDDGREDNAQGR